MSQPGSAVTVWRKSIRCESQHCVEVAAINGKVAVRDSTDPDRQLAFDNTAWREFLSALRTG